MQSKSGNNRTLIVGGTGGIGASLVKKIIDCDSVSSKELDLNFPQNIKDIDLSKYDTIINCAGHSKGTFMGFQKNTYENIISQINVNYISNILLLKRFAEQNTKGTFVWISSDVVDHPRPFHSVYASSKKASQFALDLVRQEIKNIKIIEIKFGFAKTNFRHNNFLGTKSVEEVNKSYDDDGALDPEFVADQILECVNTNETHRHIKKNEI